MDYGANYNSVRYHGSGASEKLEKAPPVHGRGGRRARKSKPDVEVERFVEPIIRSWT